MSRVVSVMVVNGLGHCVPVLFTVNRADGTRLRPAEEQLRHLLFGPSPQPSPRSTGARELFFGRDLGNRSANFSLRIARWQPTLAESTIAGRESRMGRELEQAAGNLV